MTCRVEAKSDKGWDVFEASKSVLENVDFMVLEQALYEQSHGTMSAPLRDVVELAKGRWGFPGSAGTAEALFTASRRYVVDRDLCLGRVVHPVSHS